MAVMSKGRIKTRSITRKLSPLWLEKSCHVCLKIAVTQSFSFVTAVREVFRLFLNVAEMKEKQRKCLNLLLKTKDVIGFHGFWKTTAFTNFLKLSVERPNTDNVKRDLEMKCV